MTRIATHNGKFHADEVFAVTLLRQLPQYQSAEIVRSRDPEVLKTADIVVDVGGVYDPETHRYDHHQPEFKDSFSRNFKTLLSSAGLVYKHFGREILKVRAPELTDSQIEALYEHVYESFVEAFDANDNGISAYPSDLKPAFKSGFDIFYHVNLLNPAWNVEITSQVSNDSFMKAVEKVNEAFDLYLNGCLNAWLPARDIVQAALESSRSAQDSSNNGILVMPTSCPWKDHLFHTEGTENIMYLIYPDGASGSWRIQGCPVSPDSFKCRLPLPEAWLGLRDAELDAAIATENVEAGGIFVHRGGFIGGHKTQSGAIAMARASIQISNNKKPRVE